MVLDR